MTFNLKDLETLLVCPDSRTRLLQDGEWLICLDPACRLKYAIRDDIPIMLIDEALKLSPDEWAGVMRRHARDGKSGRPLGEH